MDATEEIIALTWAMSQTWNDLRGTELSNTESKLTTGTRLITKPAAIYTGFYEMQLNPKILLVSAGRGYGLKGAFSEIPLP
jgi:hypothetical protein